MLRSKKVLHEDQLFLGAEEQCSVFMHATRQMQRLQNVTAQTLYSIQSLTTSEKGIPYLLLIIVETHNCSGS